MILQIDRTRIATAEEATRMLKSASGRAIRVFFERGGQTLYSDFYLR